MFDLRGHVALITGANQGIGLGIARGLARAGADVALWSRREERNREAVAELSRHGTRVQAFACDVADESSVVASMKATLDTFGRVDSCFANAGMGRLKRFTETSVDDWNRVVSVNLLGVFLTFRESARHMVERGGGGKLIAISSVGSIHGMPKQAPYASSKAAVCALVRSLAVELARHDIQANALLPGWIDTEMTKGVRRFKPLNDAVMHRTPARRWGTPEDLEGVSLYLASSASRFHTGDTIRVDGGYAVY